MRPLRCYRCLAVKHFIRPFRCLTVKHFTRRHRCLTVKHPYPEAVLTGANENLDKPIDIEYHMPMLTHDKND